jgi:hypothetical protein
LNPFNGLGEEEKYFYLLPFFKFVGDLGALGSLQ